MAVVDYILLGLTGIALPWAIIELGLSAYAVSVTDNFRYYGLRKFADRSDFLLFASLWTILVAAFLLAAPLVVRHNNKTIPWITYTTPALNTITMIFWLAGFAAFANLYDGGRTGVAVYTTTGDLEEIMATPTATSNTILAFAIMLWLIFLVLTVLNFLTCFGVLRSERVGYTPFASSKTDTTTTYTNAVAAPEKSDAPIAKNSAPLGNTMRPTGHP